MDFAELLAKAQRALASGEVTEEQIGKDLARLTNGQIASLSALRGAVASGASRPAARGAFDNPTIIRPRDLARAAAQGATFGFSDELAGVLASLVPGGKTGQEARETTRGNLEQFRAARPGYALGAELAGGLAVPLPVGATAARAPGLLRSVGQGIALGAGAGALAGAGYAEGGVPERLAGAGRGATYGAILGAALPVSARTAAWLSEKGLPFLEAIIVPGRAASREARNRMAAAMRDAGLKADDVKVVMDRLGERAVPADVSLAVAREARRAVQEAPAVEQVARDFLQGRQAGAGERLGAGLTTEAGFPAGVNLPEAQAAAKVARREVAAEVYKPLEDLYAKFGKDDAARFTDLIESRPELEKLWAQIKPKGETGLNFKNLQALSKRLQDEAQVAFRAGRGNEGTALSGMLTDLRDAMEDVMPGFRAANRAYAESTATLKAFDSGAKALAQPADKIQADIARLGDNAEAVTAYRTGMVDTLNRRLRSLREGADAARGIADAGPEIEAKLRAAFPDEASFRRFIDQHAARERRFAQTREVVAGASPRAGQQDINTVLAEAVEQGLRFSPGAAAARAVRGIREGLVGGVGREAAGQVAQRLTTPGRANLTKFLAELEQAQASGRLRDRLRGGFERGPPLYGGLLSPILGSNR